MSNVISEFGEIVQLLHLRPQYADRQSKETFLAICVKIYAL